MPDRPVMSYEALVTSVLGEMERAFRDGNELALHDAVMCCYESKWPLPDWASKAFTAHALGEESTQKKMGRHAVPGTEQKQMLDDLFCYETVRLLCEDDFLTWVGAFEKASEKLCIPADTLRKAYHRTKRRLATGEYYLSYLALKEHPIDPTRFRGKKVRT